MKKGFMFMIIATLITLAPVAGYSITYYVSTNGSDNYPGTLSAPWKTVAKVNSSIFLPGDSILFRRGDIWREKLVISSSGTINRLITFGAYGNGDKPQFRRSFTANNVNDWIYKGNNIWMLNFKFAKGMSASNLVFNSESVFGVEVWNTNGLNVQGKWQSDDATGSLYVYSVGNPATYYSYIEIVLHDHGIEIGPGRSYISINNLHPCYCGWNGIQIANAVYMININDNDISFCGGGHPDGETSRHGNGIAVYMDAHDLSIFRNKIWQIYDSAMTLQGFKPNLLSQYNIFIRNNVSYKMGNCFEFWTDSESANVHDVYFENNMCADAGGEWSDSQRPDWSGVQIRKWVSRGNVSNFYIRNNIIYRAVHFLVAFGYSYPSAKITLDYNLYYPDSKSAFNDNKVISTFSIWSKGKKYDIHSKVGNPAFFDESGGLFWLLPSSPAIDAGTYVGITSDYLGNPIYGVPDIGAFEFQPLSNK